jgi:hypothetical protein
MSRKLRLELEIVFYRQLLFGLLFVVEVPLVAWIGLSIGQDLSGWSDRKSSLLIGTGSFCASALVFVIVAFTRTHHRLLDELENQ